MWIEHLLNKAYVCSNLSDQFEEELKKSTSLLKDEALYLTNAIFCNYDELNEFAQMHQGIQNGTHHPLSNFKLFEIHFNLFNLIKFFWKIERDILFWWSEYWDPDKFLYEYIIRVSIHQII